MVESPTANSTLPPKHCMLESASISLRYSPFTTHSVTTLSAVVLQRVSPPTSLLFPLPLSSPSPLLLPLLPLPSPVVPPSPLLPCHPSSGLQHYGFFEHKYIPLLILPMADAGVQERHVFLHDDGMFSSPNAPTLPTLPTPHHTHHITP